MRIIFLDVDGVLVTEEGYLNSVGSLPKFKEDAVLNLQRIVQATSAEIVLSSSWRKDPKMKAVVIAWLLQHDLEIKSITPVSSQYGRDMEIMMWFDEKRVDAGIPWITLDDDSIFNASHIFKPNEVTTSFVEGLTMENALVAIEKLNN